MPFFSVIIPLYNKQNYIEDTLKSVINQTFQDFEIIIINDGSTDNSLKKASIIKDSRTFIFNQENLGLSSARNTGIKKANANYIAFLDADDLWMEDFLETMYNLISINKKSQIFAADCKILTPNNNAILASKLFNKINQKIITNYFDLTIFKITQSSLVVKKNVFDKIGYFDETINYAEDEDFYIRCFAQYNLVFYKVPKIFYRVGLKTQMTAPNPDYKRIIPDFSNYLNSNNYSILKPYLDFIHFKLVVLFKMEKNDETVKFYKKKIDTSNLSTIQKIKYHLPTPLFYLFKKTYLKVSSILTQ